MIRCVSGEIVPYMTEEEQSQVETLFEVAVPSYLIGAVLHAPLQALSTRDMSVDVLRGQVNAADNATQSVLDIALVKVARWRIAHYLLQLHISQQQQITEKREENTLTLKEIIAANFEESEVETFLQVL